MVKHKKNLRICLVASGGGHLSTLLALSESWKEHKTFFITTQAIVKSKLANFGNTYVVGECNRQQPLRVVQVLLSCVKTILYERPDVVISTGAAPGCMACFLGKLIGAKVVWIDSLTNVEKLSLSGTLVRYIADLFIVQWPELAERYSNVEYIGVI